METGHWSDPRTETQLIPTSCPGTFGKPAKHELYIINKLYRLMCLCWLNGFVLVFYGSLHL